MKKRQTWRGIIFCLLLVFGWADGANALIRLVGDKLTMTGFLRSQYNISVGSRNHALVDAGLTDDNLDCVLFRSWLQTQFYFKPSDNFRMFAKIRLINDATEEADSDIPDYDAFPFDYENDWTLLRIDDDNNAMEVWELYADLNLTKKLWLRPGKQQIVWGEMIGQRILDLVNPLDLTWHMFWEPEEFENTRIPVWAIRGAYSIPNRFIKELTLEGVLNPGDVVPTQNPDTGSPLTLVVFPSFLRVTDDNLHRGKPEYGGRITGMIGEVRFSLVYFCSYSDTGLRVRTGIVPLPFSILQKIRYPKTDSYGGSFDWYWEPAKTVINGELVYIPDFPYSSVTGTAIEDRGTVKWGIKLTRPTSILPAGYDFANLQLQFVQTYREGDENDILINNAEPDKDENLITSSITQSFAHQQVEFMARWVYDIDDASWVQSYLKVKRGNNWVFQVCGNFFGGSEDRPGRLGSLEWGNNVLFRVTYQF